MDIFEGRYFNLNRKLLTFIGQWPYENRTKNVIRATFMLSMFLLTLPHLLSAIINYKDIDRLMLNLLTFLTAMVMFLKMVALTIAEDKLKQLYGNLVNNWLTIRDKKEREILVQYSERGRILTILYTISMSIAGTMISVLPLAPKILDNINPLEKPRPNMYLLEGEFFVEREKYFIELFFCDLIITGLVTITTIAADSMYIATTEHCCALNAIISNRLLNLGQKSLNNSSKSDADSYTEIIQIIKFHKITLSFTSTINDSYSLNFLFIMTVNILIIPLDACAIIAHLNDLISLCPYATFFGALMLHFFVMFWPGQRVLGHNLRLYDDAYCNEWYTLPLRTKKLFLIFMLRCSQPASLSAGGLFLISFETYSMVMRTAISYITVLASFR